ncbi:MAG: hypothetical protein Q8916_05255 [Bacteroidota bacterium]|nr:hypothetical protein [Bacteroidota bacterium]MDP4236292.1 hypothetical protein [Bacteroidota bacterium]
MLLLRYRNSTSDPWIEVPSLTSIFPLQPAGSLPLAAVSLQTAPEEETPCGCPGGSTTDDHYILRTSVNPMPQTATNTLLMYLLAFKQATYREAKYSRYGTGDYMTVGLSLLKCKDENGMSAISFRLAAPITSVI